MEKILQPKFLIIVGILACAAALGVIQSHFGVSVTRATALLCAGLSVFVYVGYYLTGNPWLRRIAIALLPTAVIMWLINSNLTAFSIG